MIQRVLISEKASQVLEQLKNEHGELLFHQSGGCCDGSAAMCFPVDDFMVNEMDVCLGRICDCPFYMSKDQFEYWKHSQLTIDVSEGRGGSFSLETALGLRFITQSRLFSEKEVQEINT